MNLYVGNLAREVTEDDLKEAFAAFGEVESVNIIKDRFSGESRGFGFVQMPSKEEAAKAIEEADGMDLKGRSLKVSEAHQKTGGGGGVGGGRGRGGKFGGPRGGGGRSGGPRGGGRGGFSRDRGGRDDRQGGGNRRF